jgi:glycerol-3-phosphate dehydrogenase
MWQQNWREQIWQEIPQQNWDVIVVGGGITGAGILREAARLGLRVLLVEGHDFAWGTSSRSSKLVHGGLRYLKEGKVGLTVESVLERQQLLEDAPGLIDPLGFLFATYQGDKTGRFIMRAGLTLYDLVALQWSHRYYRPSDFRMLAPHIDMQGLKGGFNYGDALTDDARLVLRVISEAVADGGTAVNYLKAVGLWLHDDKVIGVHLRDSVTGAATSARAKLVINATGAWVDGLRQDVGGEERVRPLRGSHLIFPSWRLPVAQAVSFFHPLDGRPVFIFPWEGVTLVGTTDVDHAGRLDEEPAISGEEVAYLMTAVADAFPSLNITLDDVTATYAGVRPVIDTGQTNPSKESRDHVIWQENGLLTVTGGKLTTFRIIAHDALKAAHDILPDLPELDKDTPVLKPVDMPLPRLAHLDEATRRRLLGRYGEKTADLVAAAKIDELDFVPNTQTLWAELRWAARAEAVVHLHDLLLRRVRLGLLLPKGGRSHLPRIQAICQEELGWDDAHWLAEESAYFDLYRQNYSLPPRHLIPDWRPLLVEAEHIRQERAQLQKLRQNQAKMTGLVALGLWGLAGLLSYFYFKKS